MSKETSGSGSGLGAMIDRHLQRITELEKENERLRAENKRLEFELKNLERERMQTEQALADCEDEYMKDTERWRIDGCIVG